MLDTMRILVRRDVIFDETVLYKHLNIPAPTITLSHSADNTALDVITTTTPHTTTALPPPTATPPASLPTLPDRAPDNERPPNIDFGPVWRTSHNCLCEKCDLGGHLVLCHHCNIAMHSTCFTIPQRLPPLSPWVCPDCRADALLTPTAFANMILLEHDIVTSLPPGSESISGLALVVMLDGHEVLEPTSYSKALSSPHASHWQSAIQDELRSLSEFGTWKLTPLPPGRRPLSSKWVFKAKTHSSGELERFKARLVVRGFTQREGIDFLDTYAPVAQYTTLRILLALVAALDYECDFIDFSNAFLNGTIDEELFIAIPEGYLDSLDRPQRQHFHALRRTHGSRLALRLVKALYGLKQACRAWNETLHRFLIGPSMGFTRSRYDTCLYFRQEPDGTVTYLLVYVDDTIIATLGTERAASLKAAIGNVFRIRDLGPIEWVLKMRIIRNRPARSITIDQANYVDVMLRRFNMSGSKPAPTPAAPNFVPSAALSETPLDPSTPYRAAIGSLMHAAVGTRFDIKYAVSVAAKYSAQPRPVHWTMVKRIFRYLNGTRELGLAYSRSVLVGHEQSEFPTLQAMVDSDYGGDRATRRSRTGWILFLGNMPISASSKLQSLVTLSSTEAELVALCQAVQEVMAMCHQCTEAGMGKCVARPIKVFEDNDGCIFVATNPVSGGRSKHIEIKYHYAREKVESGDIAVTSIDTKDNVADLCTKAVSVAVHNALIPALMTQITTTNV